MPRLRLLQFRRGNGTPPNGSLASAEPVFDMTPARPRLLAGDTNGNPVVLADPESWVLRAGDTMSGGLSLGSATAPAGNDLTRHISLFGGTYGFSVTPNTLNHVTGNAHLFSTGVTQLARIDAAGLTIVGARDITLTRDPQTAMQAVTRQYVDAAVGPAALDLRYLRLDGGTLSGPLNLPLAAPTATTMATNRAYVDAQDALLLPLTGGTVTGPLIVTGARVLSSAFAGSPSFGLVMQGQAAFGMWCDATNLHFGTVDQNGVPGVTGMRIDNGGNLFLPVGGISSNATINGPDINSTTGNFTVFSDPNYRIQYIAGTTQWAFVSNNLSRHRFLGGSGDMAIDGTLSQGSDARQKSEIADYQIGLAEVLQLQPRRFLRDGEQQAGFVAQEVEEHIPEAVVIYGDEAMPDRRFMRDTPILAALVNAVKQLSAETNELRDELRALTRR